MKKNAFKRIVIVAFLLTFCVFFISSPIYAVTSKIQPTNASVSSKSEGVTVGDLTIDGSAIKGTITLPNKDDFAELRLSFINSDSDDYTIDSISDNYSGDYLDIEYRYDSVLAAGATNDVYAKIIYKQQVINQPDFSIDDTTITIKLTRSDGSSEEIVINPTTNDKLPFYLAIIAVSSIAIILVFRRLKRTAKYGIVVAVLLLCSPVIVLAAEKFELQPVIENIVLKSEYEEYDVSIDLDDGSKPTTKKVKYGDPIGELPDAPARTGYNHTGWEDEDGNDVSSETIIAGPITIKPKYIYNGFTITFNANGGEGEMAPQVFDLNTATRLNSNTFTRAGYEFKGWNSSPEGDGDNYNDAQQVSFAEKGETILYAKWLKLEATLLEGSTANRKMHQLPNLSANSGSATIERFLKSEVAPDMSAMTEDNILSDNSSTTPIYMWFEDGAIYWWSEDIDPSLNKYSGALFKGDKTIKSIDLSGFDTEKVTNMNEMFKESINITSINLGDTFNTANVTSMSEMFSDLENLTSLDLGKNFNTNNVTNMYHMFSRSSKLTTLNLGENFDTSNVSDMRGLFKALSSLTSLDLGDKFDTGGATDMLSMFEGLTSLTSLDLGDKFDTSNVRGMTFMFHNLTSLTSLDLGDKFNTSNVRNMREMFGGLTSLASLDLGDKFDTSNVVSMWGMFLGCSSLTSLDLGNKFDTSSATEMRYMFFGNSSLTSLDLGSKFDTSKVTDMEGMFQGCSGLVDLNLENKFNTSSVIAMDYMFEDLSSLTSLNLGDKFDTSNVRNMSNMFDGLSSLTSLDLGSKFDTSKVTNMRAVFKDCSSLVTLGLGEKFDTSNATMTMEMFSGDTSLTSLNLGQKFNTEKVTNMQEMFYNLSSITVLDLGDKFDTSNVDYMEQMFRGCGSLTTIYAPASFTTKASTQSGMMFNGDYSLVGGAGTAFVAGREHKAYAHIDGGESNPGYFTSTADRPVAP